MKLILLGLVNNAYLLVLIPFIISFFRKEIASKNWNFLLAYIYVCLATEVTAKILWWLKINNLLLLHIFSILEFFLLSLLYHSLFRNKKLKLVTWVLIILFTTFSIINSIYIQSTLQFNSYSRFAECLFIVFYAISYTAENYTKNFDASIVKTPFFLVNTGVLIFFSGNYCLFVLSNYLLSQSQTVNLYVWAYHTLLLACYYILIGVGLWKVQNR